MHWMWENYIRNVLIGSKLCQRVTESEKIM